MAVPSYIEPDDDYDDVDNPAHMENHHLETTASSFWQAEEGSFTQLILNRQEWSNFSRYPGPKASGNGTSSVR